MKLKSDMAVKQDSGNDHKLGMSYFIVIPTDVGIKSSAESYSFFAGHNDKYVAVPEVWSRIYLENYYLNRMFSSLYLFVNNLQ